jgi:hypothetical protein
MPFQLRDHVLAGTIVLAVHALAFAWLGNYTFKIAAKPVAAKLLETVIYLKPLPGTQPPPKNRPREKSRAEPTPNGAPATMAAPPAPTAQEWEFAAKYTLKNSKGYRYNWGQQVRSMMGTAVEGPNQGVVRFRVEIAPNGTLAKLETLWTTSKHAEKLARRAIEKMPPLPPTPNGESLIFERTISFSPFASDGPPTYKDDCLPDVPGFRNPFAWDGKSAQLRAEQKQSEKMDPRAIEECLKQLPQDSIEAESAQDKRLIDQWGSVKSGR